MNRATAGREVEQRKTQPFRAIDRQQREELLAAGMRQCLGSFERVATRPIRLEPIARREESGGGE